MIFIAFKFCGILMLNYEFKFHVMDCAFDFKWSFWFLG